MPWFWKRSDLQKEDDVRWSLRLRLTRWRHLLAAEGTCFDLLADLRDKLDGEYIFDRQYIHSVLGKIFQSAYQVAHDREMLEKSNDAGMLLWLDRIREQANTYVADFPRSSAPHRSNSTPERAGAECRGDSRNQESEAWDTEPECLIIQGLLDRLDPWGSPQTIDTPKRGGDPCTLRQGLQLAHDQLLPHLVEPESLQTWIQKGVASPVKDARPFPLFAIDIRRGLDQATSRPEAREPSESVLLHSSPGRALAEGLSEYCASYQLALDRGAPPLFLIAGEDSLFLTGSMNAGMIFLDVVLTGICDFNHWFLRWEHSTEDRQSHCALSELFGSGCPDGRRICEVLRFNLKAEEIEMNLKKLGKALASVARRSLLPPLPQAP